MLSWCLCLCVCVCVCVCTDEMLVKAVGTARSALAKLKSESGSDVGMKAAVQSYTQVSTHLFICNRVSCMKITPPHLIC